jgi:hypothetical protein
MPVTFRRRRWRQSPLIRTAIHLTVTLPAVVLVLVASAACADPSESPKRNEPPVAPAQRISEPSQVTRPIDTYVPSVQDIIGLRAVQDAAIVACLKTHGVTYQIAESPEAQAFLSGQQQDRVIRSSLYGFFDPVGVKTYGYGRPPGKTALLMQQLPQGPPEVTAECTRKGDEAIGNIPLIIDETTLPDSGPPVPAQDSRYQAAVADWARCMTESGFTYTNPLDAIGDPRWRRATAPDGSTPPASPAEVAAASADVNCKIKTNLVGIAVAVQSAYDNKYIESHRTQLAGARDKILSYLRSAGT